MKPKHEFHDKNSLLKQQLVLDHKMVVTLSNKPFLPVEKICIRKNVFRNIARHCLKMDATPPAFGKGILFGQKNSPNNSTLLLPYIFWQPTGEKAVPVLKNSRPVCWNAALLPKTKPLDHGEDCQGSVRSGHKLYRIRWGGSDLWNPHVESHHFHWSQHRDGSGNMGWTVDELCNAEHWADAVWAQWVCPEAVSGSTSCPSPCHHLPHLCICGLHPHLHRSQVHRLPEEKFIKGKGGDPSWLSHHYFCYSGPDPRHLVCNRHHHRLSEPTDRSGTEEGNWSCHLHRLGFCSHSSDWRYCPNHILPSSKTHEWISRLPPSSNVPLRRPSVCSPIQPTVYRHCDIRAQQTICSPIHILCWTVPLKTERTERGQRLTFLSESLQGQYFVGT